jgi:hypothetical protein
MLLFLALAGCGGGSNCTIEEADAGAMLCCAGEACRPLVCTATHHDPPCPAHDDDGGW